MQSSRTCYYRCNDEGYESVDAVPLASWPVKPSRRDAEEHIFLAMSDCLCQLTVFFYQTKPCHALLPGRYPEKIPYRGWFFFGYLPLDKRGGAVVGVAARPCF